MVQHFQLSAVVRLSECRKKHSFYSRKRKHSGCQWRVEAVAGAVGPAISGSSSTDSTSRKDTANVANIPKTTMFNPNPGTWGLFGPDACISICLVWKAHPIIPISYIFVTNSGHFKGIVKKNQHGIGKKKKKTEAQKWCKGVTRACLTRAPLSCSEVPVAMVTESFRWERTILKW